MLPPPWRLSERSSATKNSGALASLGQQAAAGILAPVKPKQGDAKRVGRVRKIRKGEKPQKFQAMVRIYEFEPNSPKTKLSVHEAQMRLMGRQHLDARQVGELFKNIVTKE